VESERSLALKGCRSLSDQEQAQILKSFVGLYAHRDRALFLLGRYTGARISQLLYLKVGHVYQHEQLVDVLYFPRSSRKGKREGQAMPLHPKAKDGLRLWLDDLQRWGCLDAGAPLFRSRNRTRDGRPKAVSRVHVYRIQQLLYHALGMTGKLGTHSMRKSFARHVYEKSGHNLLACQKALGHRDIATTVKYLDCLESEVYAAILAE
jgi:site-specific recombinase XerC